MQHGEFRSLGQPLPGIPPNAGGPAQYVQIVSASGASLRRGGVFLPLQARLGDRAFWPVMMVVAAPAVLALLRLDRTADRPERLRGLAHDPALDAEAGLLAPAPLQG